MRPKHLLFFALAFGGSFAMSCVADRSPVAGQKNDATLILVAEFDGTNGSYPAGNLVLGADGAFYGVTQYGGASKGKTTHLGYGAVFRVTTNGALTTLVSFNGTNGGNPMTGLTRGRQDNFYGVTRLGGTNGTGVAFCISTNGEKKVLHHFGGTDGWDNGLRATQHLQHWQGCANAIGGLTLGKDGNFYGATAIGGFDYGTVFRMTAGGELTYIFAFDGTNGQGPCAELAQDSHGNLYGTTADGGPNGKSHGGYGTVFKMNPEGQLLWYVGFNGTNGLHPGGGMVMGPDGNFYGTTYGGWYTISDKGEMAFNCGTIFKLSTNGILTTLVSFANTNGACPLGRLLFAADGNFYGATRYYNGIGMGSDEVMGNGAIFRMTPNGNLRIVAAFDSGNMNTYPAGGLTAGPDGNLYGLACLSGTNYMGSVFKLALRDPPVRERP